MKIPRLFKRVAYWTVPTGIYALARRLWGAGCESSRLTAEEKAILDRNRELKDRHKGQRCFILATGPSIKQQDLKPLKNELCISVSNFFVHPDYKFISPRYHCVAPYHPPATEEGWQAWLREMEEGTGDAVMFFGLADRIRNSQTGMFAGRERYYLDFRGSKEDLLQNGVDLAMPTLGPQSVSVMALQVALYLGCSPIYLLGCDHDHLFHLNTSTHFYEEPEHVLVRMGYDEWFGSDFASYCQDYVELWRQYKLVRCIAESGHVMIANATAGGILDVFPCVRYETIIAES